MTGTLLPQVSRSLADQIICILFSLTERLEKIKEWANSSASAQDSNQQSMVKYGSRIEQYIMIGSSVSLDKIKVVVMEHFW